MKLAVESDHPVTETARDLGVNVKTLHTWIGKYHRPKASGKAGKNDEHIYDELKRLRKEVARLKGEHAILKKAATFFYEWLSRPESKRSQEDKALKTEIRVIHERSRKPMGPLCQDSCPAY